MSFPYLNGVTDFFTKLAGHGRIGPSWWLRGGAGLVVVALAALVAFVALSSGTGSFPAFAQTDTTAPQNVGAFEHNNDRLRVYFNEEIDADSVPLPASNSFAVPINGTPAGIRSVTTGNYDLNNFDFLGNTRWVAVETNVAWASDAIVTVRYTKPTSKPLQDEAGNEVDSFGPLTMSRDDPPGTEPPATDPPDTDPPVTVPNVALVSNTDQTIDAASVYVGWEDATTRRSASIAFTTGSIGATLSEIGIRLGDDGLGNAVGAGVEVFYVGVWGDSSGIPTGELRPFNPPVSYTANAVNTFTSGAGVTLQANTTYHLLIQSGRPGIPTGDDDNTNRIYLSVTNSDNEDSGRQSGWNIGNTHVRTDNDRTNASDPEITLTTIDSSLVFTLNGVVATSTGPIPTPTATPTPDPRPMLLVSNIDQDLNVDGNGDPVTVSLGTLEGGGGTTFSRYGAVAFTTGDEPVKLGQVDIRYHSRNRAGNDRVRLFRDDSGLPGDRIFLFSNPRWLKPGGVNTFTAPEGVMLEANTTYHISMGRYEGGFSYYSTTSIAEDSDSEPGWSIGDDHHILRQPDTNFAGWQNQPSSTFLIALRTPDLRPAPVGTSFLRSSSCDGKVFLTWNAARPREDISGYEVRWWSGNDEASAESVTLSDPNAFSYTISGLDNGTAYTLEVGLPYDKTVPPWFLRTNVRPSAGACISGFSPGAALSNSVPLFVDLDGADAGTRVNVQYRSVNPGEWSEPLTMLLEEGDDSLTFGLTEVEPDTYYEARTWLGDPSSPPNSSLLLTFRTSPLLPGTRGTGGGGGRIERIEPSIGEVTLSGGDRVVLSVEAYGRQGLHDNGLLDKSPADGRPVLVWHSDGGGRFGEANIRPVEWSNGDPDDRQVYFTAPDSPGTVRVTASLVDSPHCLGTRADESEEDRTDRCRAVIDVTIRRGLAAQPTVVPPVNPPGDIPGILSDADGNQYEVFTPVDGGTFNPGVGYSITADAGAVPNGEFIGIRMSDDGAASNVGLTRQRYTLGGNMYGIHAVDSAEAGISSYVLDDPATVCLPLPPELARNISDLAVVAINGDGSLTILSASVRISSSGNMVCGSLSSLPASVAVGSAGAPAAIPTPTPDPTAEVPDTGGTAPGSSTAVIWALLLGMAVLALGSVLVIGSRRESSVRK